MKHAAPAIDESSLDDLFPDAPPRPVVRIARLATCVVCGDCGPPRAHPAHDVCVACAAAPDDARARLGIARQTVIRQQQLAAQDGQRVHDGLTPDERARYGRLMTLRGRVENGDATPDEQALVARSLAGLRSPDDPRFSDALRTMLHADECLFWANEANEATQRRLNVALAQLALCLEDTKL